MGDNNKVLNYLHDIIYRKIHRLIKILDIQITSNLNEAGIETRPAKTNGLWCCALLPAILLMNIFQYNVSPVHKLIIYVSVGQFFYCLLFILFMSVSCLILQEQIYGGCIASSLCSALLVYLFISQDLTLSLISTVPSICLFSLLLRYSLTKFPKTFTIGEAMIVTQSIVLFGLATIVQVIAHDPRDEINFVNAIVFTILTTVALIVTALYMLKEKHRNLSTLAYIVGFAIVFTLLVLHFLLGASCMLRILNYVFMDHNRINLLSFWLFLVLIAALVVVLRTSLAVKASTVTRKSFHILASCVFLSGILYDVEFMRLAAGGGLGLLVLVEALRKSRIEPISSALQSAFNVYSDEKDVGSFAMTPMYLYAGLACPLVLVPVYKGSELELLSGVLSIGVGDTAASWFGSRYGFNTWPDSSRTMEGTTFNILSQVITVYVLQMFDLVRAKHGLVRASIAALVSGLVEAQTGQVDNLILPLVSLLSFQATCFLR
ncbi:hypothetical protein K1T71_009373 [Dendrolimus kikuchii]|uniref:Uncharacterized protein n=1 Tax=Dendrolimus kikuchii TaxID=765133 RepID=A0ACC1CUH4_9NEOP|nr:hypothetical protein K1T71_009373 [Dendrolimus kikuchii]